MTPSRARAGARGGAAGGAGPAPADAWRGQPVRRPGGGWRRHNLRTYLARARRRWPSSARRRATAGAPSPGPFTSRQVLSADTGGWGLFEGQGFIAHEGLGRPWAEATATLVWRHLRRRWGPSRSASAVERLPLPSIPPPRGRRGAQRVGNRGLTRAEVEAGALYLRLVLGPLSGVQAVAVGRVAARALDRLGVTPWRCCAIRRTGARTLRQGAVRGRRALRLNTIATGPRAPADAGAIGLTLEG